MKFETGIIAGPTAVGKSAVAQLIAERNGAAVLSADSMLVYKGMDVGTAKPTVAERGAVPYYGIDCVGAGKPFSVGDWLGCIKRELSATPPPAGGIVTAGGTGMYLRALLSGLDSSPSNAEVRAKWEGVFAEGGIDALVAAVEERGCGDLLAPGDRANPRRVIRALELHECGGSRELWRDLKHLPVIACLRMDRLQLASRIARRVEQMFANGLVEEALALRKDGMSRTAFGAIGYAEALAFADGELTREEAAERICARTRQLAKRQMTWFRGQLKVAWIDVADGASTESVASAVEEVWRRHGKSRIEI